MAIRDHYIMSGFQGRWSDGWGRRPVMLVCLIATAISYVILGASQSLLVIISGRIMAGKSWASLCFLGNIMDSWNFWIKKIFINKFHWYIHCALFIYTMFFSLILGIFNSRNIQAQPNSVQSSAGWCDTTRGQIKSFRYF